MKVLFAVNNESVSESIVKKYQKDFKEIISYKNVYYFNAIIKEMQRDKTYDRIVISEDLEPFANNNYDTIDKFLFEKLDSISDEAEDNSEKETSIILICADRRTKSDNLLVKLFGIGIYSAIIGRDRSIEEVCRLINKPRNKKEAKLYYKVDSDDVTYQTQNDTDVSETEIQSILKHYKSLGKNEEKYVESFDNIASQYTDAQLRIIIKFLSPGVKAVLETQSTKYQEIVTFGEKQYKTRNTSGLTKNYEVKDKKKKDVKIAEEALKIDAIEKRVSNPLTGKPIIIPSTSRANKKIELEEKLQDETTTNNDAIMPVQPVWDDEEEEIEEIKPETVEIPAKKGRGRPKKVKEEPYVEKEETKRKRGRPKKVKEEAVNLYDVISDEKAELTSNKTSTLPDLEEWEEDEFSPVNSTLPGLDEDEYSPMNSTLPGLDEDEYSPMNSTLPGLDDDDKYSPMNSTLPGLDDDDKYSPMNSTLPGLDDDEDYSPTHSAISGFQENRNYRNEETQVQKTTQTYTDIDDLSNLLTKDKKMVSFVGTTKNGTSFIVNNLAILFSSMGINTAILDVTRNKNSYYIYTNNDENLRKTAMNSIQGLQRGLAEGVKVNKNLTVYTSLPGEPQDNITVSTVLGTLAENYSLILIDCDFDTDIQYFAHSQEIYLVQTMDILTIQPLTAFLRDLKNKGVLNQEKLRIVLNKTAKVKGLSEKVLIGGIAYYNDPSMSFMTELFNKDLVKFTDIPFDLSTYTLYLESMVNCNVMINKYNKAFMTKLKELANMVYPLLNKQNYKPKQVKYSENRPTFSSDMNNTLNQMRNKY